MFANNVPKKQINIRMRTYFKRNDLAISFVKSGCHVLKTFIIFVSGSERKLSVKVGEK